LGRRVSSGSGYEEKRRKEKRNREKIDANYKSKVRACFELRMRDCGLGKT
jgi:hypothetical protein